MQVMSTVNPELPADYTYTWPWGETGACASHERVLIEQLAANLGRPGQVQFVPIQREPPPITRDERIALRATAMALEEDLIAARAEGGRLLAANQAQAVEIASLQARLLTYETALRETSNNLDQVLKERDAARVESARLAEENARLRALVVPPVAPSVIEPEPEKE